MPRNVKDVRSSFAPVTAGHGGDEHDRCADHRDSEREEAADQPVLRKQSGSR